MSKRSSKVQLDIGKIYVTNGGLVTLSDQKDPVPWGYDRVRLIKITKEHFIVETPWASTVALPLNYSLAPTNETVIRSEFCLENNYISCETIPFAVALKRGICKELTAEEVANLKSPKTVSGKSSKSGITEAVIVYLETPKTIRDTAIHFGVTYQKIRYILKRLVSKGYGFHKYQIKKVKLGNKDAVQLVKG